MGISYSQSQSGAYVLILVEANGKRQLPITIGGFEAQAIAIELEKMKPQRPLTHDLFKSFAELYDIKMVEAYINKHENGVFFARLICDNGDGLLELDARTSDAVALAVRFQCPIYTDEEVMRAVDRANEPEEEEDESSDIFKEAMDEGDDPTDEGISEFSNLGLEELENLLATAIQDEAFERASQIRDEINRRKAKED
jgi:bifunctional DNase/RNase